MGVVARTASRTSARSVAIALALVLAACRDELPEPPAFAPELQIDVSQMERSDTGLYMQVLNKGRGAAAPDGAKVMITYKGWLPDGKVFDTNEGGEPFLVTLSKDFLIDGVMEGLQGIRVGEIRRVVIPPDLGYGETGDLGYVPRNSWLVYELRRVGDPPTAL